MKLETINSNAGNEGAAGIVADAGSGTYNIENNQVAGFNYTGASSVNQWYWGIRAFSAASTYVIRHNSIDMPHFGVVSGPSAGILVAQFDVSDVANNLIRIGQSRGYGIYGDSGTAGSVEGNCIFMYNGAKAGRRSITEYTTHADWQAAGFDSVHGRNADPTATTGGQWTSTSIPADLHFNGARPMELESVIPTVTSDIDGETRHLTKAYPPGMYEQPSAQLPVSLSIVEVE